jgi:DNA polymerase-3 subunit gamma/tau
VSALRIIDRLINEGKDAGQVVLGLIEHFRNVSIAKISKDLDPLIDAGEEKIKEYRAQSQEFTIEEILYIIYTLSNTIEFIRKSNIARIPLEAAMVKLTRTGSTLPMDEVMKKLDMLSQVRQAQQPSAQPQTRIEGHKPEIKALAQPERPETVKPTAPSGISELLSSWQNVINYIMPKKISIASYLQEGYPLSLESNTLTIGFPKALQFHKEVLESTDNKRLIEEALKVVTGIELRAAFALTESGNGLRRNGFSSGEEDYGDGMPGQEIEEKNVDPIVRAALDVFGGDIAGRPARPNGNANRRRPG